MWSNQALEPQWPVAACIGIASDTHMPDRLDMLPPALFDVLAGVDLVLHAGDVGELSTLDQLAKLAPVVAVHGNDDTSEAHTNLPYQQTVVAAGQRIVLCHGHYPDHAQEIASRQIDEWAPKLSRLAAFGHRAGAQIAIFGHAHIPFAVEHEGVLLLNPGGIAPPNLFTRMRHQTVALLYLPDASAGVLPLVAHVDLAQPDIRHVPTIDWNAGFTAAHVQYVESILAPDLQAIWRDARARFDTLGSETVAASRAIVRRLAQRCWRGELPQITLEDVRQALEQAPELSLVQRDRLLAVLPAPR